MTEHQPTVGIRRKLTPFGGVASQAELPRLPSRDELRERAIRTMSRQYCFDHGYITVKDLDDEELVAGRCRNANGYIPKAKGKTELIPCEQYDLMVAEHELRYKQRLRQNLDSMLSIMVDIAEDDTVEPRDRFEAAKYIFERTAGKTPDTVNVTVKQAPWEELLSHVTGIAPMSREEHRQMGVGIVDAEIIDIDEDDNGQETEDQAQAGTYNQERGEGFNPYVQRPDWDAAAAPATMPTEPATGTADGGALRANGYVSEPAEHSEQTEPTEHSEPYQEEPNLNYGRRADEKRSYAQQAQDAQSLARRRKEAKAKIKNATKQRKIARAMGADAIKDEITGVALSDDGKLHFEQE